MSSNHKMLRWLGIESILGGVSRTRVRVWGGEDALAFVAEGRATVGEGKQGGEMPRGSLRTLFLVARDDGSVDASDEAVLPVHRVSVKLWKPQWSG